MPVSTGGQVVLTGNVHKVAALLHAQLVPPVTGALRKVGFLGCELEWNVPEQTPEGLYLTTSFLLKLLLPSSFMPTWGTAPC